MRIRRQSPGAIRSETGCTCVAMKARMKLGDMLIESGKLTQDQLDQALVEQRKKNEKLGTVLLDMGFITDRDLFEMLEVQFDTPSVDLSIQIMDQEAISLIPEEFATANNLIAFKRDNNRLHVAMSDPLNLFVIDDLEVVTNCKITAYFASRKDISKAISRHYSKRVVEKAVQDFKREFNLDDATFDDQTMLEINNAPIVRLVNTVIMQAVQERASDIHIEPGPEDLRIRFRTDGEMYEVMRPSLDTHSAIVSRLKIMAKLDIAEKRVPQDGRIELNIDRHNLDMRVSTLPTVCGEKVVIRIIERSSFLKTKEELGLSEDNSRLFDRLLSVNSGIILVTGPTGSGKSTTLYTMLKQLNDVRRNIVTVEDPVEYRMSGINQVQVNPKANLTFAGGLRSILRQDPDVIMIGEIRDTETAEIAVRASITGHLVLSTLHTNSAVSTIGRLIDMEIAPFLINTSVIGIIAQRLVKKICPYCKQDYRPTPSELEMIGHETLTAIPPSAVFSKGTGCVRCHGSGYFGRIPIHEFLVINDGLRKLISKNAGIEEMNFHARANGFITLQESCADLIMSGRTTFEEFERVVYALD